MSREAGKPLPIETLPRTELEKIQNKRLRYTLRMAYEHTKFWHEKFDNLGMKPEDIKTKEDLIKAAQKGLNMTDEDLVFNYAKLCAKYLDYEGYTILTTSGTSGKGWKQVPYTNSDFSRSNEQVELLFNKMNVRKGSKNLNGYGPPPNASGILVTKSLEYIGASQFPLTIQVPSEVELKIIKSYKPEFIWKIGTKVLELGNEIQRLGEDPTKLGVKGIGIGGEPFSKTLKEKLRKKWGCEVTDLYASAETSVAAFECNVQEGMHVCENRVLLTTTNPETYEEDKEGKILITLLYKED